MNMSKRDLLVVGAGLTGSLTASLLSKAHTSVSGSSSFVIKIWEKAKGAGGRMSTHRHRGPGEDPTLHVDMGAQYISRFQSGGDRGEKFEKLKESLYDELLTGQVLVPFRGTIEGERKDLARSVTENYVAPGGINGVVKHFLSSSGAQVKFQHQLESLDLKAPTSNELSPKILCRATNGTKIECDGVVLTMPVPQVLSLRGNINNLIDSDTKAKLETVHYSSRYALGLFYNDGLHNFPEMSWSAKYFDDPIVRFASWGLENSHSSSSVSGAAPSTAAGKSLLVHTGVPFGIEHLEHDKMAVKDLILEKLNELIPGLPQPTHSHIIRWRYSQVSQVYPGAPGCVVLSRDPLVVVAGDGFSGSNFENCVWTAMCAWKVIFEPKVSHITVCNT